MKTRRLAALLPLTALLALSAWMGAASPASADDGAIPPTLPNTPKRFAPDAEDIAYLPYVVKKWHPMPELANARFTDEILADPNFPVLVGDDGWKLTLGQVNATLWVNGHQAGAQKMIELNRNLVLDSALQGSFINLVREEAIEKGYGESEGVRSDMRLARDIVLKPVLTRYAWATRGKPVTDQMVELAYERDKMTKYRKPMGFEVQQIFLMAYEPYTVQPGDTLRSIAAKVTGAETAVTEIRSNDATRAKRWVPESQRDRLAFRPLVPGEELLVPADQGGMERIWAKAREIEGRLEAGEDFDALSRELSEDDNPGQLVRSGDLNGEARILPEILQAIKDAPVGEATPFIRTKHGLQKFKVLSKTPEEFAPLERAAPYIRQQMERDALHVATTAFFGDLRSSPVAQLKTKLIDSVPEKQLPAPGDVIANVDGHDITFEDAFGSEAQRIRWANADKEDRKRILKESITFNDYLYDRFSRDHGVYQSPMVQFQLGYYFDYSLAKRIEADYKLDNYRETTPLVYRFYRENQNLFREPFVLDLRVLEKDLPGDDPDARSAARELMAEIAAANPSDEEFAKLIRENADDPIYRETSGLLEGALWNELTSDFRVALSKAEAGDLVGPFEADKRLYLVRVLKKEADVVQPFEEEKIFKRAAVLYETFVRENLVAEYYIKKLAEVNARVNPVLLGEAPAPAAEEAPAASGEE